MTQKKKITIIALVAILILVIIPVGITVGTHYYYFGTRISHSNDYFDYLSGKNPNFEKEPVQFVSNEGQMLSGGFYKQSETIEPKGLIVWAHGMGVNHENYLGEIEYMTKEGYVVFSYDNTGVEYSEGESLHGLIQAPLDLQKALEYVYDLEIYNDMPNILIGHSWGGFSVASVSGLELPREVDGIVSLAGFWKNTNAIEDIVKGRIGDVVSVVTPYLTMYEKLIFKDNASINALDGLKESTGDVLIIHSVEDSVVLFENNYEVYEKIFGDSDRFTFIEYDGAGHKLTINKSSYNRIHDIMHDQHHYDVESEEYIELNDERLSLIEDFNEDVMGNIVEFCEMIVAKY